MDYDTIASTDSVTATATALTERGFLPEIVATRAEALARIKELIPAGASVMNGSSRTLEEIGYIEYLKAGQHGWNNLHEGILAETDPAKQAALRKQSVLSDFYLGSAHAITQTGEIVIASNSGSQMPHLVFTSQNIILVVSAMKITPTLDAALARLREHVYPLEDARMKQVYGPESGSFISKLLILNKEPAYQNRKFHVIFVNEKVGF